VGRLLSQYYGWSAASTSDPVERRAGRRASPVLQSDVERGAAAPGHQARVGDCVVAGKSYRIEFVPAPPPVRASGMTWLAGSGWRGDRRVRLWLSVPGWSRGYETAVPLGGRCEVTAIATIPPPALRTTAGSRGALPQPCADRTGQGHATAATATVMDTRRPPSDQERRNGNSEPTVKDGSSRLPPATGWSVVGIDLQLGFRGVRERLSR